MKNLWFKREHVEPILNGFKTDTIRKYNAHLPAVGDIVHVSVGPIRPFARVQITEIKSIDIEVVNEERRAAILRCYDSLENLFQLSFKLVENLDERKKLDTNVNRK